MVSCDKEFIGKNVYLFCVSKGLASVVLVSSGGKFALQKSDIASGSLDGLSVFNCLHMAAPFMETAMRQFIARQNIAHYKDQLKAETEPLKRAMLLKLLAEEEAVIAASSNQRPEKRPEIATGGSSWPRHQSFEKKMEDPNESKTNDAQRRQMGFTRYANHSNCEEDAAI